VLRYLAPLERSSWATASSEWSAPATRIAARGRRCDRLSRCLPIGPVRAVYPHQGSRSIHGVRFGLLAARRRHWSACRHTRSQVDTRSSTRGIGRNRAGSILRCLASNPARGVRGRGHPLCTRIGRGPPRCRCAQHYWTALAVLIVVATLHLWQRTQYRWCSIPPPELELTPCGEHLVPPQAVSSCRQRSRRCRIEADISFANAQIDGRQCHHLPRPPRPVTPPMLSDTRRGNTRSSLGRGDARPVAQHVE